jgi:hypothetical protein
MGESALPNIICDVTIACWYRWLTHNLLVIGPNSISHHLGKVIPTLAVLKKGSPQQVTHCGIFCLPWHRHSGTHGKLGFKSHSKNLSFYNSCVSGNVECDEEDEVTIVSDQANDDLGRVSN